MNQDNEIDLEIMNAISDELKDRDLDGTLYAQKVKQRIVNKLVGKFDESDLMDLIEDMPDWARSEEQ